MSAFVTEDLQSLAVEIDYLAAQLDTEMGELLDQMAERMVHSVQQRITDTKIDPSGADWEMWAESTARYRERKGNASQGILWDTGRLLDSIRAERRGPHSVAVGSDVDYAVYLQKGTETMPDRPFLGFSEDDRMLIQEMAEQAIEVFYTRILP